MLRRLILMSVLVATPVLATPALATPEAPLPSRAAVSGVAANDVLNVRAEPNAKARVLGTLAPDAKGVEVVNFDPTGQWAKVSLGELSGWASGRFLVLDRTTWVPGQLPSGLHCIGTEPFWSLAEVGGRMSYSEPGGQPRDLELRRVLDRGIAEDAMRALIAGDDTGRVTAVVQPETCSDGMSDRDFGLAVTVILDGGNQPSRLLNGCCSVAR